MANFRLKDGEHVRTVRATKAAGVTILAGDLVDLTTGLVTTAGAASTVVAWAPNGAASAQTYCDVTIGNDFTLIGTANATFTVAKKGAICDLAISGAIQYIDIGTSSTNVLKVGISETAGVVGSAANITVKINKPVL